VLRIESKSPDEVSCPVSIVEDYIRGDSVRGEYSKVLLCIVIATVYL